MRTKVRVIAWVTCAGLPIACSESKPNIVSLDPVASGGASAFGGAAGEPSDAGARSTSRRLPSHEADGAQRWATANGGAGTGGDETGVSGAFAGWNQGGSPDGGDGGVGGVPGSAGENAGGAGAGGAHGAAGSGEGSGGEAVAGSSGAGGAGEGGGTASGGSGRAGSAGSSGGGAGGGGTTACSARPPPPVPARLGLRAVVSTGSSTLVYAAQPPGSRDWYLVEQDGVIRVAVDGALRSRPFLDLRSEIELGEVDHDDRGLLGLAFAPDYAESGLFYVAITPSAEASPERDHRQIREYRRSADRFVANARRERTIVDIVGAARGAENSHQLSTIAFGPDGMLYAGVGDGGSRSCSSAEPGAPQDVATPFGKILRLDPGAPAPHAAAGNPFASSGDPRVLHYGLRNPFRFAFDRVTGDLYIGDVGQASFEEIDFAARGARGLNFGWPAFEGTTNTCPDEELRRGSRHTRPIFIADRRRNCAGDYCDYRSIVGGVVYRGSAIAALQGAYVFGDVYGDRMNALYQCGSRTSAPAILRKTCDPNYPEEACFVPLSGAPELGDLTAIVEDDAGELYFVANGSDLLAVVPLP